MKLKIAAIGLILVAACLSGCIIKDDSMIGTYRCEVDGGVLDLLSGDEWVMLIEGGHEDGSCGMYSIKNNTVRLKMMFLGIVRPMYIDGRDLIDPDGDRWVRD